MLRLDDGFHTASRVELSCHLCGHRLAELHDVSKNSIHRVFIKDSQIPVRQRVHLERLQFQAMLVRHVAQRESSLIRQSGARAA